MSKKTRTAERKKEREESKRRNQVVYGVVAIAVIAVVAAIVYLAATSVPSNASIPSYVNRTDNILQDKTAEGFPRLGNPNAPVEVREFASFSCAGCLTFHEEVFPQLLPLIESGAINFVFVPLTTGSVPNPEGANKTAICAGEQGKFWQMHDVLFSWQSLYVNTAFQDGRLRGAVSGLGLDSQTFNSCVGSATTNNIVNAALASGVSSTPTVYVANAPVASASYELIVEAVTNNLAGRTDFESGLKPGAAESTQEAVAPTSEATSAIEATEASEATAEATAAQ